MNFKGLILIPTN